MPLARTLRRRAGRRLHRRGQAAGAGDHARAQARDRRALATTSLTTKYGVAPEDIIFDALVFPVGTGDQNYIGSGVETIEGIRLIKRDAAALQDDPRRLERVVRPAAGRARGAELGLPLPLRAGRPRHGDRQLREARALRRDPRGGAALAEDLIWWRGDDPIAAFAAHFREQARPKQTVEERKAPAARRAPGALHPRGLEGRALRRSRRGARRAAGRSRSSTAR